MAGLFTIDTIAAKLKAAGIREILVLPETQLYTDRISSYWSDCAKLHPWAIIQPRTTEEVSLVVKTLVAIPECKFAIRSGGHTYWTGSNNIQDGVTIDLGLIDSIKYDAITKIASLGPGGQWKFVYAELEKHGVMVPGGRVGNVGIGGLLLGGGNTFFTCRKGFACDNVVNYEVVLADGSIVSANKDENKDLFLALKGGSNNFGIVTRFDMETFEHTGIWGGVGMYPNTTTPELIAGFVSFTQNLANEPASSLLGFWGYSKQTKDIGVMVSETGALCLSIMSPLKSISVTSINTMT
jgi:FAD/FMN-containing dehydrogenase